VLAAQSTKARTGTHARAGTAPATPAASTAIAAPATATDLTIDFSPT
jgi:hypothetical protein